jgi:hypothetical protein
MDGEGSFDAQKQLFCLVYKLFQDGMPNGDNFLKEYDLRWLVEMRSRGFICRLIGRGASDGEVLLGERAHVSAADRLSRPSDVGANCDRWCSDQHKGAALILSGTLDVHLPSVRRGIETIHEWVSH